jgi:hypothetical protein
MGAAFHQHRQRREGRFAEAADKMWMVDRDEDRRAL